MFPCFPYFWKIKWVIRYLTLLIPIPKLWHW
jgi:hypothetical protein